MAAFKPASLVMTLSLALMMGGCRIAEPLSPAEEQTKSDLASSNYYPATRELRSSIETQPLFAQAAFWGREYNLNPSDLESAVKLSAAVRKLGNPQRAIEIAQTTRALYPRDPYLAAEFAAALIASERAFDAMKPLDDALRVAPNYARLWSLKGAALDQTEQYDLARKHYDRALRITPRDPNILANLGLSYALSGDPVTAETWLRRASSLPNASPGVRQNLALVLQLQGKTAEAEKIARLSSGPQQHPSPAVPPSQPLRSQSPALRQQASQGFQGQGFQPQGFQGQHFQSQNYQRQTPQNIRQQSPVPQNLRGKNQQAFAPTPPKRSIQQPNARPANTTKARLAPSDDLTSEQRNLLNQIAGNLNPQQVKQNHIIERQAQSQQSNPPQVNAAPSGYPTQAYTPQDYGPQVQIRQPQTAQARNQSARGAARRKR